MTGNDGERLTVNDGEGGGELKAVVNGCEAVGDWWIEGGERRRREGGKQGMRIK